MSDETLDDLLEPLAREDDRVRQARESLEQTLAGLKLTPEEETALADELRQLRDLTRKLDESRVEIAAFGMVSRGKSSVLNALAGRDLFPTGVTHGTTTQRHQHPWDVASVAGPDLGGLELVLVDTPGIEEVGGEAREELAEKVARHADLILFIVSGDMQRVEHEALSELRGANKPIILVFNQIDRYPEADREAIRAEIVDERVKDLIRVEDVVLTAARPDPIRVKVRHPDGRTTEEWERPETLIEPLKLRILKVLEREGKELVALNALLIAGDLHEEIVAHKLRIREESAARLIWKFAITKGAAVALNPVPVADLAGGLAVDIAMIVSLSRLYGIPLTRRAAAGLVKDMTLALGALGAVEVAGRLLTSGIKSALAGVTILSGGLAAPLTAASAVAIGLTQGATAALTSYVLGRGAKYYLQQGCQWGPRGIRTVVHQILQEAHEDSVLARLRDELRRKVKG